VGRPGRGLLSGAAGLTGWRWRKETGIRARRRGGGWEGGRGGAAAQGRDGGGTAVGCCGGGIDAGAREAAAYWDGRGQPLPRAAALEGPRPGAGRGGGTRTGHGPHWPGRRELVGGLGARWDIRGPTCAARDGGGRRPVEPYRARPGERWWGRGPDALKVGELVATGVEPRYRRGGCSCRAIRCRPTSSPSWQDWGARSRPRSPGPPEHA